MERLATQVRPHASASWQQPDDHVQAALTEVPFHPMGSGQLSQYLGQSGAIAELPGQGLGRA
jgi:hypothetical protein